ncbi:MAG: GvpL/GvpF family gas vesicle protein [Elusimicrobia bacterium]|nr:GvpL/GvpF family gas vesicle protein [Elusimicrobiota bacterium]
MEKEGRYIYCIIKANKTQTFGPLGIGGKGDQLYTIAFKDIAAVVSNSPIIKYPVSRENLISHEKAIEEVMKEHTVLPVRFCTIAADDKKIREILETERDKFSDLLGVMSGKKELGLKAVFHAKGAQAGGKEDIYGHILEKHADIRILKEKIAVLPVNQTHAQRMAIGEMVEAALQKEKERCKEDILNILSPLAVEVKVNSNYGELMILSAAFLVEQNKEAGFDRLVEQLGVKYGNRIKFKYVGTLPLFNFVNLVINTD